MGVAEEGMEVQEEALSNSFVNLGYR